MVRHHGGRSGSRTGKLSHRRGRRQSTRRALLKSVVALLPLVACSERTPDLEGQALEPRALVEGGYPREVATFDGGPLRIEARPERILPANSSALDFLAALVNAERFVAIPAEADSYASLEDDSDAWSFIPRMERYTGEDILSYRPDLVVAHTWQDPAALRVVRAAGVPVITIPEFKDFDSLRETLRHLGEIVGEEGRGSRAIAELEARREALLANEERRKLRAMVYTNYGSGGWTAGTHTSAHTMIELTGMRNAAAEAGLRSHQRVDIERVLLLDPDVLILSGPERAQQMNPSEAYVRNEEALQSLRALRHDRLAVLPANLYGANSQFLVDAAEELARQVDAMFANSGE